MFASLGRGLTKVKERVASGRFSGIPTPRAKSSKGLQTLESGESTVFGANARSRATLTWPVGDASRAATTLRQVLASESLRGKLLAKAKEAHADEGVLFLVSYFTSDSEKVWRERDVRRLMEMFLLPDSPHLLTCLSGPLSEEVHQAYLNFNEHTTGLLSAITSKQKSQAIDLLGAKLDAVATEVFIDVKRDQVFRSFILTDEEAVRVAGDAYVLDDTLGSAPFFILDTFRDSSQTQDVANMIQFCISVDECELDVVTDRPLPAIVMAKLKKIVEMYVMPNSTKQLDLPVMYQTITEKNYTLLRDARSEILQRLANNPAIMARVRELKAQLSPMNISRRISVRSSSLVSESKSESKATVLTENERSSQA